MSETTENTNKNRSTGPKTPEGKHRSSLNSIRHGLTAKTVVLDMEDASRFEELLHDYISEFSPATKVELDLVHELTLVRWRMQRVWSMETITLDIAIQRGTPKVDREFKEVSESVRVALAFQDLAENTKTLNLLNRYEIGFTRRFHHLLGEIDARQAKRKAEEQRRKAEEHREAAQKKAAEAEQPPEVTETPGDPRTCRVLLTIPKSLLRNELPQLVPQPRRDAKIEPREDKIA